MTRLTRLWGPEFMWGESSHQHSSLDFYTTYQTLVQVERHLRSLVSTSVKSYELTVADFLLLVIIEGVDGGLSQRQIAQRLSISPAQTSARLETLRRRGLVLPERSNRDRRKQTWSLATDGQTLCSQAKRSVQTALQQTEHDELRSLAAAIVESIHQAKSEASQPRLDRGAA